MKKFKLILRLWVWQFELKWYKHVFDGYTHISDEEQNDFRIMRRYIKRLKYKLSQS